MTENIYHAMFSELQSPGMNSKKITINNQIYKRTSKQSYSHTANLKCQKAHNQIPLSVYQLYLKYQEPWKSGYFWRMVHDQLSKVDSLTFTGVALNIQKQNTDKSRDKLTIELFSMSNYAMFERTI